MTKHRTVFRLIAALLILAVFSSAAFVVLEADHECLEDSCLICDRIAFCLELLRAGLFAVLCTLVLALTACFAESHLPEVNSVTSLLTPILLKVKLSD